METILGTPSTQSYALRLAFYALAIISSHMVFAFFYQKIFKTPYARLNPQKSNDQGLPSDYFTYPLAFNLITYLFCYILSFFTQKFNEQGEQNLTGEEQIPWYEPAKIASLNVLAAIFSTVATILSSFIVITIVASCQLIAVVILAVFCSRVSSHFRVKKQQIFISSLLCLGVITYVLSDKNEKRNSVNKSIGWLSGLLLLLELFCYAFRQEFFAQLRDKYSTVTSNVTLEVSKYSLIITLIISICTTQLWQMVKFVWQHDSIVIELILASFLNAFGLIFCFRTSLQYKQHIMPTIGTVRKLLSLLFSTFYFHHELSLWQYGSIILVFGAIFIDIYMNYLNQVKSQNQRQNNEQFQAEQKQQPSTKI